MQPFDRNSTANTAVPAEFAAAMGRRRIHRQFRTQEPNADKEVHYAV
jgi:hypothetical protein